MIKEASESNFGAKKVFSKKLKWESPYFSNCDLHEALDILSLYIPRHCDGNGMVFILGCKS